MKPAMVMILTILALGVGATGCLIIPTPHSDSGYARTNVNQQVQHQFVPGRTTREDVIMALGEPDVVSRDECCLAYRSEKVVALWVFAAGYQATGGTIYKNHYYIFEFNPEGFYQTNRLKGQYGLVQGMDEPQLNSPVIESNYTKTGPAAEAGEMVRHEYPKCFWLAGVDGYRSKGSTYIMGLPGRLSITESNVVFVLDSQFANSEPALKVPLASVIEVRVDKWLLARRLVIHLDTHATHSFSIQQPGGIWQDKAAMQAECAFIQSKIKSTPLVK